MIETVYTNRHMIPEDLTAHFEEHRKRNLNTVEKIGLEAILCEFVKQFELEEFGEFYFEDCRNYTRWNSDSIDFLDGVYDTYVFDGGYAIGEMWIAYDSCIMLSCYELKHEEYDDPAEILYYTDWQSECKPVLFRLD